MTELKPNISWISSPTKRFPDRILKSKLYYILNRGDPTKTKYLRELESKKIKQQQKNKSGSISERFIYLSIAFLFP